MKKSSSAEHRKSRRAGAQDVAARQPVGRVAGDQEQKNRGQKLRQPDQPQIQRAPRKIVDLPPTATACISLDAVARKRPIM